MDASASQNAAHQSSHPTLRTEMSRSERGSEGESVLQSVSRMQGNSSAENPQNLASLKRPYSWVSEPEKETSFSDEARSVAIDLGMLSLNADSRQEYYIGSSSGRFFTQLIGVEERKSPEGHSPDMQDAAGNSNRRLAHPRRAKNAYEEVYATLRQVCVPLDKNSRKLTPATGAAFRRRCRGAS